MEEKILGAFKIISTPQRIEILRLIIKRRGSSFILNDLKSEITQVTIVISNATLVTTLQLFHTRHLLLATPAPRSEKGRPPIQHRLAGAVTDLIDSSH